MLKFVLIFALAVAAHAQRHQATLYYQNTSCTNHSPCSLQIWRAVCPTPTTCPSYQAGSSLWTRVSYGAASATPTAKGTAWIIYDKDPTLQDNTTYAYCATNSFQNQSNIISACSPVWQGTTGGGNTPPAPTLGTGNSVD